MRLLTLLLLASTPIVSAGQDLPFSPGDRPGMLVMAHGGTPEWDAAVREAVRPLREDRPVAIAFGMADPTTLQEAADELAAQDVTSIVVVRLFVSGASFLEATEFAFGLSDQAPEGHSHHGMDAPRRLDVSVPVLLSSQGLLDASELGRVLARRAGDLSSEAAREAVLIIGHGPGSDTENEAWIRQMDAMADEVRASMPFAHVQVETLREDWTGKREAAEARIRTFVEAHSSEGRTVVVVPFRLYGFGPYGEVLDGLDYRADGRGLLPSRVITDWIDGHFTRLVGGANGSSGASGIEP